MAFHAAVAPILMAGQRGIDEGRQRSLILIAKNHEKKPPAISDRRRKVWTMGRSEKFDQTTNEPACARAMPTPKNIVLPMIAPKSLFPKVFMSISINLMIGR